jgi:hypothetical protein
VSFVFVCAQTDYTHVCVCVSIDTHVYKHVCVCVCMNECVYAFVVIVRGDVFGDGYGGGCLWLTSVYAMRVFVMQMCVCVCVCVCVYTCTCVRMHVYLCTYACVFVPLTCTLP